jgi:RsiW-degrading membrane proteinase PrsW (M82 family)
MLSVYWQEVLGIGAMIIGPALFWGAYHLYKDRHAPEPPALLLLSFALGIGAGYLGRFGYELLGDFGLRRDPYLLADQNLSALLVYAVFVIGAVEELAKFIPFWLIGIRHHHFDEPIDGIIYASFVALGFASYENLVYLRFLDGWVALGRSIASPLVHVMFASIWGYACSRAQIDGQRVWPRALAGVALAALVHGLYDFVVIGLPDWMSIGVPVIILSVWVWRMRLIEGLRAQHMASAGLPVAGTQMEEQSRQ